ncbi:hypothetical protein [Petrachloros mirabilis]
MKLTDDELERLLDKFNIPPAGRDFIRQCREGPSRPGQAGRNNTNTDYPSELMGHTVPSESRGGEYALELEIEYSRKFCEYHNQLPALAISRNYMNGSTRTQWYHADILTISQETGFEVLEPKDEKQLAKLVKNYPSDWIKTETGYVYKPAAEAFAEIGLPYRVISNDEFRPIRTANLRLLLQARRVASTVTAELRSKVQKLLAEHAWLRLQDIREKLSLPSYTPLFQLVDEKHLFASLTEDLLTQPDSTIVTSSPSLLAIYREERAANQTLVSILDGQSSADRSRVPTAKHAKQALKALERVRSGENSREVRRFNARIREGMKKGLSAFQALLPDYPRSGNRKKRLNPKCEAFLNRFIEEHMATPVRLSIGKGYGIYKNLAKKAHPSFPPVSEPTFRSYLSRADQVRLERGRGGRRAANAASAPSDVEKRELRATTAFEAAALDHCLAKVLCVLAVSNGIAWVARPWITVLRDLHSGAILAVWASFRAPSRRTDAIVIRRCVRAHGRLPAQIFTDGGSDFKSVYFRALMAHCRVAFGLRPPEMSRGGAEIERFFGRFITEWLSRRPGNLVHYDHVRAISGTHKPSECVTMDLDRFMTELLEYVTWFNDTIEGIDKVSPNELLRQGLADFPFVGPEHVEDHEFIVASAVDVRKYTVDPSRGIHIDGIHYWHPALSELSPGRKPEVRIEPENPYRVYAHVKDDWVTCSGTQARRFETLDPVLQIAEAMRVLDGRTLRDQAKDEAEQQLISRMLALDSPAVSATSLLTNDLQNTVNLAPTMSLFDELRSIDLQPAETSTWEK